MKSPDEVGEILAERRKTHGPRHAAMNEIAAVYDGTADVPLPELARNERPAVSNLVKQAIDQEGMRIASPVPNLLCPATRSGEAAAARASDRKQASLGAWERNDMDTIRRIRARHLLGFALTPCVLWPDPDMKGARWEPIDPRMAFPPPARRPGEVTPPDFIYVVVRTMDWLRRAYPDAAAQLRAEDDHRARAATQDQTVRLICHIDSEAITLVAERDALDYRGLMRTRRAPCSQQENRAGVPLATCPTALTLSAQQSQFEGMLGMYQARAQLMALSIIATRKGVFPNWWLSEGQDGRAPDIKSQPDPWTGRPGVVTGRLTQEQVDPQYAVGQIINEIEAAERMTGSVPPDFGGSSATNVRTGRRGAQIMSAAIDFYVEEGQHLLARAMQDETSMSAEIEKAWFGGSKKTYFVNTKGARGYLEYDPAELFAETTECRVTYALAGSDMEGIVIGGGQRVGMDTLSRESFMEMDPLVDDVDHEKDRIRFERLEAATMSGIEQQAASGEGPFGDPLTVAKLAKRIRDDRDDPFEAVVAVNKELQEEAAALAQQQPLDPMSPEAQAGLGGDPMAAIAPVKESVPGMANLAGLMMASRGPSMTVPGEAQRVG